MFEAPSIDLDDLRTLVPAALDAIASVKSGEVVHVAAQLGPRAVACSLHGLRESVISERVERVPGLVGILADTERLGFVMSSMAELGPLLRVLAASKPGGRLLELGTGTGVSAAWLLAGMDAGASLLTIENDPEVLEVAKRHLGGDARVTFRLDDGASFLQARAEEQFDLVFADTWPGKFYERDLALALVGLGGIYVVDDLLPQPSWPPDHREKVASLVEDLRSREGFVAVEMSWSSGVMMLVRAHAV